MEKPKLITEKIVVKIDDVVPNPWNPNKMPEHLFEKMKKVIAEKGLFGSVIVRPYAGCYQLLDGEHRVRACKELGWTEIPVECSEVEITDEETKFWTMYFNNMRGKDDVEKVAKLLNEISSGQAQLLPMSEEEQQNTKELFKFDFSQFEKRAKEASEEKEKFRIIIIDVPEEEYKLWQFCKKYAEKEEQTIEKDLLVKMCKDYLAPRLGSEVKDGEVTF
jgi:hypothetical protein